MIFQGSRGGGVGSNIFQGGGVQLFQGVQLLIPMETYRM